MQKGRFTITPESGNGNGSLQVSAAKYYGDNDVEQTLTIKTTSGEVVKNVTLKQKANQKSTINLSAWVRYKGESGTDYLFDCGWDSSSSILTSQNAHLEILLTGGGGISFDDISIYTWQNEYNDSQGEQNNIRIAKTEFRDIDPANLKDINVIYNIDLDEQNFYSKIIPDTMKYYIKASLTADVIFDTSGTNNQFKFTLKDLNINIPSRDGDALLLYQVSYIYGTGPSNKKTFNVNGGDLNTAKGGEYTLLQTFEESLFTTNYFVLQIVDPKGKCEFEIELNKANVNAKLDYDGAQRELVCTPYIQYALNGDVIFTNIMSDEGDYASGDTIISSGELSGNPVTINRTDQEPGTITVNFTVSGGDVLRVPYGNNF